MMLAWGSLISKGEVMRIIKRGLPAKALTVAFSLLLASCAMPVKQEQAHEVTTSCAVGDMMRQTTLYFGVERQTGAAISEKEWQAFIDRDVTPRFKEGLTVFDAKGQWLGKNGQVSHENSKALMLIYAPTEARERSIEVLRTFYKQRFAQESVMRVDAPVCVGF